MAVRWPGAPPSCLGWAPPALSGPAFQGRAFPRQRRQLFTHRDWKTELKLLIGPVGKLSPASGASWEALSSGGSQVGPGGSDNLLSTVMSAPSLTTPCSKLLPQVLLPQRPPHGCSHGPSGTTFSHQQASASSRWLCLCKLGLSQVTPPYLLPTEQVVLGFVNPALLGSMQDGTGIQVHSHTASWRGSFWENRTKMKWPQAGVGQGKKKRRATVGGQWRGQPTFAPGATTWPLGGFSCLVLNVLPLSSCVLRPRCSPHSSDAQGLCLGLAGT